MSYRDLVIAGYQGWHNTPQNSAGRGWGHYLQRGVFGPRSIKIDMWPDVSEYEKLYLLPLLSSQMAARPCFLATTTGPQLSSDLNGCSYGVDGVFVQRFVGNVRRKGSIRSHFNKVLSGALSASRKYKRAIAVMYDLTGMRDGADIPLLIADWKNLVDNMKISNRGDDQTYLFHNKKPLVVLWGVGFNEDRSYTLKSVKKVIDFLKNDPEYGQSSVMLGVPTYWREQVRDTDTDPQLHTLIKSVDIIHP